jgi:Uma2 family endonuclease
MATIAVLSRPAEPPRDVHYPESDGKPMGETDRHAREMMDKRSALEDHFRDRTDVYVSGNLLLYYVEGDPRRSVSPDVFVVPGIPKRERPIYKLWEEGRPPAFVLEITSRSTRREDVGKKHRLYEQLGVAEYFLYDPLGEWLSPPLQGYTLVDGRYQPVRPEPGKPLVSAVLGLELHLRDGELRLFDPASGRWLLSRAEAAEARRAAEAAAAREREARRAAEAELVRLRAELDRLRGR